MRGIAIARASAWFDAVDATAARVRPLVKRGVDIVMASVFLTGAIPLLLVIAAAIKLDSRGPVLYRVRRVGYRGAPLMMLKFRKMYREATGIPLTANGDERLTRVGRVLHRTRLDELPQFWEVLRGRMSIIGPRPEDPHFVALYADAYKHILAVRPGITGPSQLAFAEEHKILDKNDAVGDYVKRILPQKVGLDMRYADGRGMRRDLAVFGWTVVAMLLHQPIAVHRSTLRMNIRKRRRPSPAGAAENMAESASRVFA